MHHTYLLYTPTPLLSLHRSLPCLPHSKLACTHDLHMHTHIDMPLSIDTFPCHTLYTPLRPAPHTYVPPSHLYPVLCPHRSLSCLPHSITACSSHIYPHRHASAYRCLPMPCTLRTPEPTPCTNTCLPSPLYPVLCPHRSLPHSKIACTHDHHMATHIGMPLPIGDFPCHALYTPLSLHHAHVHASLTPPPLCLHIRIMYLMSLPHSTIACTHDHRMPVHISMPLPIDACAHNRHDAHDAHTMHTMLMMHTLHTMHTRCT